jgi:hypothetical protein
VPPPCIEEQISSIMNTLLVIRIFIFPCLVRSRALRTPPSLLRPAVLLPKFDWELPIGHTLAGYCASGKQCLELHIALSTLISITLWCFARRPRPSIGEFICLGLFVPFKETSGA